MHIYQLTLTGFAACSLLAAQANAQPPVAPAGPAKLAVHQAPALATTARAVPALPVTARSRATTTGASAGTTLVAAAGNMLVLADGIVAHAHTAQVLPPAAGFQYEH